MRSGSRAQTRVIPRAIQAYDALRHAIGGALLETLVAHDMVVARPAEQLTRASHATLAVPGKVTA